jgi:RNase P subunit RPR2
MSLPYWVRFGEAETGGRCRKCHAMSLVAQRFAIADGVEVLARALAVKCQGCGYRSVFQYSGSPIDIAYVRHHSTDEATSA